MFDNSVKMGEDVLITYVDSFPAPAHIKDVRTKCYAYSNQANLVLYGLQDPKELIGLNIYDVDRFMKRCWGDRFADYIDRLDQQVSHEAKTIVTSPRILLDSAGLLRMQSFAKVPVLDKQNNVASILTTTFDCTDTLNKFDAFRYYHAMYKKKQDANRFFMLHVKILPFFAQGLSTKEIECLLHMVESSAHKFVARRMNVSPKTVEAHSYSITSKMIRGNIMDVLGFLRMSGYGQIHRK